MAGLNIQLKHNISKFNNDVKSIFRVANGIVREEIQDKTNSVFRECLRLTVKQFKSLKELRRAGHPYARNKFSKRLSKGGNALGGIPAPYIINYQSGELWRGWKKTDIPKQHGNHAVTGNVWNNSKHAEIIAGAGEGDSKMIKRPIMDEAIRRSDINHGILLHRIVYRLHRRFPKTGWRK